MMDLVLEAWVSGLIELSRIGWVLGAGAPWTPGEKLRLLFAGYNGTRNTGSDLRVEEMLRQVRRILGEHASFSVMTQNFDFTRGYFGDATQVHLPDIFPPFLHREVRRYHGVVACEGSMFKSKFANALTTMMIGSLGIAAAENKLSVGYGGDADHMDRLLAAMCRRYCRHSLVITRNEESRNILAELGVPTELGTDTGWTFEPHPPEYARKVLRDSGWDERTPVLILCPINPFFWPVKPSLVKFALHGLTGAYKDSHYRTVYFHNSGPAVDAAFQRYLTAWANAVNAFRTQHDVFPVLVGTERLDADACRRLAERLGGAPVFTSEQYDIYQLVSILRAARLMVSSRYHAVVTSMPALVPSAGVTMDERIRNLMRERGHTDLLAAVDDPELESKILAMLEKLMREGDAIAGGIGRTVVRNLKVMARMGTCFEQQVLRRHPEFPVRSGPLSWEDYLPPLSPALRKLVEAHGG
ncbi:MAG: polysaccharide pyruvyl transferase family protein [Terriglobales bacterium]